MFPSISSPYMIHHHLVVPFPSYLCKIFNYPLKCVTCLIKVVRGWKDRSKVIHFGLGEWAALNCGGLGHRDRFILSHWMSCLWSAMQPTSLSGLNQVEIKSFYWFNIIHSLDFLCFTKTGGHHDRRKWFGWAVNTLLCKRLEKTDGDFTKVICWASMKASLCTACLPPTHTHTPHRLNTHDHKISIILRRMLIDKSRLDIWHFPGVISYPSLPTI